jgi:exodeoxyribonuclease VII large subunit
LARLGPILIERPRRVSDAAGRALARERALLGRRRGERAHALLRLDARMVRAYAEGLQNRRAQLVSAWQLLGAMSYRGVLSRGFALVRDEAGAPLRRAAEVRQAQRLEIEFADGKVGAVAGGRVGPPLTPPALLPRRRAKPDKDSDGQASLF